MILENARNEICKLLSKAEISASPADIIITPDPKLGDFALPLFALAKERKIAPAKLAQEVAKELRPQGLVERIEAAGPYLNFWLNAEEVARIVLDKLEQYPSSGVRRGGRSREALKKSKKYLVEFSCANPMKAFHLGHLRNTITGESVSRILENAGYSVLRINYQGDVGMHIAKSLWGISKLYEEFEKVMKKSLDEQIAFLGRAYAHGAQAFENDEQSKKGILEINKKVYAHDESVEEIYTIARAWSLEKFETIYERLGTHFEELYFESEMWKRGMDIAQEYLAKGIFRKGDGAIIFPGSEYGLHDRVFITTEGNPTYEAKDLALSERRHTKHHPDMIIHVVGKEQTEYFKVVFKALEYTLPESKGKEYHLPGGFLQLKEGKMSSRTGNVVLAEALLDDAASAVKEIMKDHEVPDRAHVEEVVSDAAVKYSILRNHVSADTLFDIKESVSLSGDSGPYLLYIVARIKSILRKADAADVILNGGQRPEPKDLTPPIRQDVRFLASLEMTSSERALVLSLARFPEITTEAAETYDPSRIAHYLFDLAQTFNAFYQVCPVLQAEDPNIRAFRFQLIAAVSTTMTRGLFLLGIKTVEAM